LDEGHFHVQAGLGDRFADGAAELGDDRLAAFGKDVRRGYSGEYEKGRERCQNAELDRSIHWVSPVLEDCARGMDWGPKTGKSPLTFSSTMVRFLKRPNSSCMVSK